MTLILGLCVLVSFVIEGSDGNDSVVGDSDGNDQSNVITVSGLRYRLDTTNSHAMICGYDPGSTEATIKLSINYNGNDYAVSGIDNDALFEFNDSDFSAYEGRLIAELRLDKSSGTSEYVDALGNKYALFEDNVLGVKKKPIGAWYLKQFGDHELAVVCTKAVYNDGTDSKSLYVIFGDSYWTKVSSVGTKTIIGSNTKYMHVASFFGNFTAADASKGFKFDHITVMSISGQAELMTDETGGSDYYSAYLSCSYAIVNPLRAPDLEVLWMNGGMIGLSKSGKTTGTFDYCPKIKTLYMGKDAAIAKRPGDSGWQLAIRDSIKYTTLLTSSDIYSFQESDINIYPSNFFEKDKCTIAKIYVDSENPYYANDSNHNLIKRGTDQILWKWVAYEITGEIEKGDSRTVVNLDVKQYDDCLQNPYLMIITSYDVTGYSGAFANNLFIPIESAIAAGSQGVGQEKHTISFSFSNMGLDGISVAVVDGIPNEGEAFSYYGYWQPDEV